MVVIGYLINVKKVREYRLIYVRNGNWRCYDFDWSYVVWCRGGIMLFFASGAGEVVNAQMPLDFITHDSYWVVGHFHLMLMGTVSLALLLDL
ncbi:MAG: cbb3-type cytochrome c oxidase subunit I [Nitrososphaeraceae archaeon]